MTYQWPRRSSCPLKNDLYHMFERCVSAFDLHDIKTNNCASVLAPDTKSRENPTPALVGGTSGIHDGRGGCQQGNIFPTKFRYEKHENSLKPLGASDVRMGRARPRGYV